MAAETGNINIFGKYAVYSVEIQTADLEFLATANSIKISSNTCDNDRRQEIELQLLWR